MTASVLQHRGGFLFILITKQIPHRYTKVLGNLICGFCVEGLLAACLQIRQDATANTDIRAKLCTGDGVLGAEGGNMSVKNIHMGFVGVLWGTE